MGITPGLERWQYSSDKPVRQDKIRGDPEATTRCEDFKAKSKEK